VRDIESRIYSLFTDDGLGSAGVITCSSVHKAKGLEADNVFVLEGTFRPGKEEENNIYYVAVTRAKNRLIFVQG
jgi:superfamily I DNA/RNA helicase